MRTGFVLRTWPLRESDLIVSILTQEHGKIRGVARAAKSPKGRWLGALDPLVELSVSWKSREGEELLTLTDCSIVRSPYRQSRDLPILWTLAFIAELVDTTAPAHDPDETTGRLLRSSVDALLAGAHHAVIARYVAAWVLQLHGVLPDPTRCADCGIALVDGGTWHWRVHGVGCARCVSGEAGGPVLLAEDIAFLGEMRRCGPAAVATPDARVLRRVGTFLRHLVHELAGKPLKSERFLDELDE